MAATLATAPAQPLRLRPLSLSARTADPLPTRSVRSPATLLQGPAGPILVDAGDGTAEQLAKVGVRIHQVRHIVLTHLHADHTGGLFAMLRMRFQLSQPLH